MTVEASHANALARAIAFFSNIWFKYDILSLHGWKLRSVVIIMLRYQPPHSGSISLLGCKCVMQYTETGKDMHKAIFFLLQNLALQLGLGQRCQPEGIAITWQQLLSLRKRRTVTFECGSLRMFCTTSSSCLWHQKWMTLKNCLQIWNAMFDYRKKVQIGNFLKNKQRNVWSSNIAFFILQKILQSHPFLMTRNFERQDSQ